MSFRVRTSCNAGVVLAAFLLACAANKPTPASAHPRSSLPAAPRGVSRPPRSIDGSNIDRVKLKWEALIGEPGRAVAVSRRFGQVAFGGEKGVRLYALSDGKPGPRLGTCTDVIRRGVFYRKNSLVVVCAKGVDSYDVSQKKSSSLAVDDSRVTAASLVKDELALGHHDGVLRVYDLLGGPTIEVKVPGPPIDVKSMALSPDGKILAVAWIQGSVWWWRLDHPGEYQRVVRHEHESDAVAFSLDGKLFAEEGKSSFTTVWSVADPAQAVGEIRNGAWVKRIRFLGNATWMARGGSDGLEFAEVRGPKRIVLDTKGKVEDVGLDEQGSVLAAVDRMGRLTLWGP